jgi:Single-stranded DNA-specific exonuclease
VIAFAPGGEGELKGSARSIPGFHIRDALEEVSAHHPGLIRRFGGHAMAAGLTLEADAFDEFARRFDEVARRHLRPEDLEPVILSDGEIEPEHLGLELALELSRAGPWGQGFPEPLFHGEFQVVQQRLLKEKHWKLVVRPAGGDQVLDAIGFNLAEPFPEAVPERVLLAYRLEPNEFRGNINPQLQIVHMEPT